MTNYLDALALVFKSLEDFTPATMEINLEDANGYVLADDIIADTNLPPFDYSTMDGYAVKYSPDTKRWKIAGEITAGNFIDLQVNKGVAICIMTGGKIPKGADTVIPVEDIDVQGNEVVLTNNTAYKKGTNIRYTAEDLKINEVAVGKGTTLEPHVIQLAAACGKSQVSVFKPFKIGILSTGDELLDINEVPGGDKIRNTNIYTLISAIKRINMCPVVFGGVIDKNEQIKSKLQEIIDSDVDFLVTTGGVSVGKHDLLPGILNEIGAERIIWKANIKPGKPFLFNIYKKDKRVLPIFSLPGNPASCFVNFEVIVRPVLMKLLGITENRIFPAILSGDIKKKDSKRHFVLGIYNYNIENMFFSVKRTGRQSSGDMVSLSRANCLIIFPEEKNILPAGERVECIRL